MKEKIKNKIEELEETIKNERYYVKLLEEEGEDAEMIRLNKELIKARNYAILELKELLEEGSDK